jgi:hypothetical protein
MSKKVLLLASFAEGLTLFPAAFFGLMGVMIFDAPGSEKNPLNYFLLFSIWGYVICVVLGLIIAWSNHSSKKRCMIGLMLPLIPIATLILSILLSALLCDGQTRCDPF